MSTGVSKIRLKAWALPVLALVVISVVAIGRVKQGWPTDGKPMLHFDSVDHDFGLVFEKQTTLQYTFIVRNDGPAPIAVHTLKAGCGCVDVQVPENIPPHAVENVNVDLRLEGRRGPFAVVVTLGSSDPARPVIDLNLRCTVVPEVLTDPPFLSFKDVPQGKLLEGQLKLTQYHEANAGDSGPQVRPSNPAIACLFLRKEDGNDAKDGFMRTTYYWQVRIDSSRLPRSDETYTLEGLQIDTGSGRTASVPVDISFQRHPFLKGQRGVFLSTAQLDSPIRVRVTSRDGSCFQVVKVTSSHPSIKAKVCNDKPARFHDVLLQLTAGSRITGEAKAVTQIFCTNCLSEPYELQVLLLP